MRWVYALLNKLIPLDFSIVPHELPTIHNVPVSTLVLLLTRMSTLMN